MIPPSLERFVERVNRREYWESHEVLEKPWRANGSDFLQGLILYASAFVHVERGNRHGIGAQLSKAEDKLRAYPDSYLGVDVAGIRDHIGECLGVVERAGDVEPRAWIELVPLPALDLDPSRVRGDEPELESG